MWTSPIYQLNRPLGITSGKKRSYEQIVIDVTNSAPPFPDPGKTLGRALGYAIRISGISTSKSILDFGAGKLRNALYLLRKGYKVCAVEFRQLFEKSEQAKKLLELSQRHGTRFSTLIYPHQFKSSRESHDFGLLINVLNIMPVPAERLLVLLYCHEKLKPNAHLLWYTQRGDPDYRKRMVGKYRLGDGYYVGRDSSYKTFYREFKVAEIDAMLASAGFEFLRRIKAGARNQARLYRRLESSPLVGVLSASKITAANVVDESIPKPKVKPNRIKTEKEKKVGLPNPNLLKFPILCIEGLKKIAPGKSAATGYQKHVKQMIEVLFSPQELRNLKLEEDVFGGIKRLDILASNKSKSGFFYSLTFHNNIQCPTIVIECKNYSHEIGNPELDQMGSRLGDKLGRVGILAYRRTANRGRIMKRCQEFFNNERKVILPLNDNDFRKLLELKSESKDVEIETYLDDLLLEVKARTTG